MPRPPRIPVIDDLELHQLVRSGELPVVLEFWAPWCTPCRQLGEDLAQIALPYQNKIVFARIDIDASPEVSEAFDIGRIPTLLAVRHNLELGRLEGDINTSEIQDFLNSIVPQNKTQ